jgi:hypothetical protein
MVLAGNKVIGHPMPWRRPGQWGARYILATIKSMNPNLQIQRTKLGECGVQTMVWTRKIRGKNHLRYNR